MVFLRLSIKVFPREQVASSSNSSWGRSLLGGRKSITDDSSQGPAASATLKKPGVFLLVIKNPEELPLGGLAGMIQEHWGKLHPELEVLAIKKIVDDTKEEVDLHPDLTVADVWVDYGKARADGLDQQGFVRVIQKPTLAAPERFPSVEQDWDAAIATYEHKRVTQMRKKAMDREFPAIQEEDEEDSDEEERKGNRSQSQILWGQSSGSPKYANNKPPHSTQKSPVERRHRDVPLSSVEVPSPITTPPARFAGPIIAGTPPVRRESEELGESPPPAQRRPSSARSRSTPASEHATMSEMVKPQKIVKLPISGVNLNPRTQSDPSSSEASDFEPTQQQIKRHMAQGTQAPSVPQSPQTTQIEAAIVSSGEESDEKSSNEGDKEELTKKSEQWLNDEDTGSDSSDSEVSEEDELKNEAITHQIDQPIVVAGKDVEVIDLDADGDVQMDPQISDDQDLLKSQHNVTMPNTQSRKRKQGSVESAPVKEARREQSNPSTRQQSKSHSLKSVPEVAVSSQKPRQAKSPLAATETALPPAPLSPQQRRERTPSFSSPRRRAIDRQEQVRDKLPQYGIGLGITKSPRKKKIMPGYSQESVGAAELPSTQHSFGGPLVPGSNGGTVEPYSTSVDKQTPATERTKKSAIRAKDSPILERRSVSFLEENPDSTARSTPHNMTTTAKPTPRFAEKPVRATPSSATRTVATKGKPAQYTPTPAAQSNTGTPSTATSSTSGKKIEPIRERTQPAKASVYPPGFDVAKLREDAKNEKAAKREAMAAEKQQKEKEKTEKAELERKLQHSIDPQLLIILAEMIDLHKKLANSRMEIPRRKTFRVKLDFLRKQLRECEQKLGTEKANPQESVARQPRPTLKHLLNSQQEELAAKMAKPRVEIKPTPPSRSDVYEVHTTSESESDSDSDSSDESDSESESGDIMPDGHSEKLRKPWPRRPA